MTTVTRAQALRFRARTQQLGRATDPGRALTDAAVLDLGVQATGPAAYTWSLANRGVPAPPDPSARDRELGLAWTVRGAPHAYRRADLPAVEVAVRPFSEADAGKRIFDANRPLKQAGIPAVDALTRVAALLREIVDEPRSKGEVSGRLTAELPDPYLRWCRSCATTHAYEQPFRLAALHAGLELAPDTSPPVLRRIDGWPRSRPDLSAPAVPDPTDDHARLDLVRACVHLLGPTTPELVAGYLDAPVRDVRGRWPSDAVEVVVVDEDAEASPGWVLAADLAALESATEPESVVRLLGPFDLLLQARDRELLVPDPDRRAELWPVLGRPGAVVVDGVPVGVWRPRASGRRLRVLAEPWGPWGRSVTARVRAQAKELAAHRGLLWAE
ncbi:winged helix DNA-binding domain-containing protein [Cellulomonas sp. RIT-PI-Y]|uniref:winged helix DNA-binding domain-containing protein n=1 Tax=Cellulomonas sp. RIT-PI-Y TaxID=3035297 RepID=UPI0021D8DDF5|nr:winged helix DNA-binding domain-containing protein [Cellulomonas sp. RIT-PI-Y]